MLRVNSDSDTAELQRIMNGITVYRNTVVSCKVTEFNGTDDFAIH